jgi:rhamnosyltransferase
VKSSSGQYFPALDHVRAVAIFTVFVWHFSHPHFGARLAYPVAFPLNFFSEGHTGVAIFMTLSGYLFAKLLDGREIHYSGFLWNRFVRLAPLLALAIALEVAKRWFANTLDFGFAETIAKGLVLPTLPNGGWSVTVEFHFYLILPIVLLLAKRSKYYLLLLLIVPILLRALFFWHSGSVQLIAYETIVGRLDQFILGIFAYQARAFIAGRHLIALSVAILFLLFWHWFDVSGGYFAFSSYPSSSPVWIVLTTIEGVAYATLIAWYDNSFSHREGRVSRFVAAVGTYSYSIYLFHFFFVFWLATYIDRHVVSLANPYVALIMAIPCFLAAVPLGSLSYRYIEAPFLRLRTRYYH